ncbi:sigma-54-dependent Fis family transcriptional regulator [Methylobacterium sp. C25]|uniref:sigma-54-dependent transcriptional regulator n=1 Tax=Methylobacterium sp. C25 TaxID=2721622 RepID=UPI001F2B3851|nr:sigma-54 dependent transcriptional regulator [Methylobacterium sp. C25]MCE4226255.1 sigma-54-dependent Fis family transcriptional regulator [Methylobacterium sp. C25]
MSLEGRTITLIEDDPIMGESLVDRLTLEGATVRWLKGCAAAVAELRFGTTDLVISDIRLPDGTGEEVFGAVSAFTDVPPFLFITGHGDIDQAVRLMRAGAGDYLTKPFEMTVFLGRVEQLLRPLERPGTPVLGVSPGMIEVERLLRRIGRISSTVLLTGETGVGKEVCARFLHGLRAPDPGPFVAVNCAAIPKDLMESELLGHEKGAFTGAATRHLGYAERARNGILFLDEIGELDLKLQAKLLRLIEDRSFHRVGGEIAVPLGARLVCATNADLTERVKAGTFREDLYYRINVLTVPIPPLRMRPDDVEWLATRLLDTLAADLGSDVAGIGSLAMGELRAHSWPGNARELRNRIERAVALAPGRYLMTGDLFPDRVATGERSVRAVSLEAARDEAESREIRRALADAEGGIAAAAAALGISRTTMWEKMRRLGIDASSDARPEPGRRP